MIPRSLGPVALSLALVLLVAGCGSRSPEVPASPMPPTATVIPPTATPMAPTATLPPTAIDLDVEGSWQGTTADGKLVSFDVVNNALTSRTFRVELPDCSKFYLFGVGGATPIVDSTFYSRSSGGGSATDFSGSFTSPTTAEGRLELTFTGYVGCNGSLSTTWTATKSEAALTATDPAPVTPTASPAPISTTSTRVSTPSAASPTATPVILAAPLVGSEQPGAVVKTDSLNVRSGPGAAYAVIGSARKGDVLGVIGQFGQCAWLKVNLPKGQGWVNGEAQYITLNATCAAIPVASAPPPPTPKPTFAAPAPSAAAGPIKGAPVHVDLTNADAVTIGGVLLDNSLFYLPLARSSRR